MGGEESEGEWRIEGEHTDTEVGEERRTRELAAAGKGGGFAAMFSERLSADSATALSFISS